MHRTRPAARVRTPHAPHVTAPVVAALDGVVLTAAGVEAFDCPVCGRPRDLIPPDCPDDHAECPDRACAVCGFAVSLGSNVTGATRPLSTSSGMTA